MRKIFRNWTLFSKTVTIILVSGLTITGCRRVNPDDNENDPYISCELPTMNFPALTANGLKFSDKTGINLSAETTQTLTKLTILSLNDTHGSIEQNSSDNFGFGRVSTYINSVRDENDFDDVVTLAAGDMFQGSALSNLTKGQAVIDVMDQVGFDAMTIGNHEFDWGITNITKYDDDNIENGEASFPILNSNIVYKASGNPVSFTKPYQVIQRENLKIGIIGLIGYGLESSIATQMIKDYRFSDPITTAGNFAEILRNQELVDIVIALGHFDDEATNRSIANLSGSKRVDAIINGHGHQSSTTLFSDNYGPSVPVVEAGANAQRVGRIDLSIDTNKNVTSATAVTTYMAQEIIPDAEIETIIAASVAEVAPIMNRVYGVAGENLYSASSVYNWAPSVIQKGMGVDVGITNSGGLRSGAFPIYTGAQIKYSNMVALMPFDNYLIYMKLPGSFINTYSSNLKSVKAGLTIKNDNTLYRVAIVDYVADGNSVLFGATKSEYTRTNILLMDLFAYDVYVSSQNGGSWRPSSQGASLSSICSFKN